MTKGSVPEELPLARRGVYNMHTSLIVGLLSLVWNSTFLTSSRGISIGSRTLTSAITWGNIVIWAMEMFWEVKPGGMQLIIIFPAVKALPASITFTRILPTQPLYIWAKWARKGFNWGPNCKSNKISPGVLFGETVNSPCGAWTYINGSSGWSRNSGRYCWTN